MEKQILIIDDDSVDREFFSVMFPLFGFKVESVESLDQGLHLLTKREFDLIFIDYHISGQGVLSFVRSVKSDDQHQQNRLTPIMMLTEDNNPENKIEGYEAGVEDYIIKPYNFLEILARVRAVLRTRELAHQVSRREQRITLIESLNSSLIYFSRRLRKPMLELIAKSDNSVGAAREDGSENNDFARLVRYVAKSNLAALDSLEQEINELLQQGTTLKDQEVTPELLEEKYRSYFHAQQKRFSNMQKNKRQKDKVPKDTLPEKERNSSGS